MACQRKTPSWDRQRRGESWRLLHHSLKEGMAMFVKRWSLAALAALVLGAWATSARADETLRLNLTDDTPILTLTHTDDSDAELVQVRRGWGGWRGGWGGWRGGSGWRGGW